MSYEYQDQFQINTTLGNRDTSAWRIGVSVYYVVLLTFLVKLLYGLYNEPLRLGVRERRENCKNQTTLLETHFYIN
jgi:hypothetical protein